MDYGKVSFTAPHSTAYSCICLQSTGRVTRSFIGKRASIQRIYQVSSDSVRDPLGIIPLVTSLWPLATSRVSNSPIEIHRWRVPASVLPTRSVLRKKMSGLSTEQRILQWFYANRRPGGGETEKPTAQLGVCGLWCPKDEQQWPRRVRNSNKQCIMITKGEISEGEDI